MPKYSFEDQKTGEEHEVDMPYSELEKYLADNPNIRQTFRMNLGDPVRMGVTKVPSDFSKYVLGRVKETNPLGKAVERRHTVQKEI